MDTYVKDIEATTSIEELISTANRYMGDTYDPPKEGINEPINLWWYQMHSIVAIAYYTASRSNATREDMVSSYGIIMAMSGAGSDWKYYYDEYITDLGNGPISLDTLRDAIDGMDDGL